MWGGLGALIGLAVNGFFVKYHQRERWKVSKDYDGLVDTSRMRGTSYHLSHTQWLTVQAVNRHFLESPLANCILIFNYLNLILRGYQY